MTVRFEFEATFVHETESAILLDVGETDPVWFPLSQIKDLGDGTYSVPEWLAIEKELT